MILLFNFLVFGLLLVVAVWVFLDYRNRRRRSPVAVRCEKLVPPQPSRNGHVAPAAQRVIGLSAKVRSDGVHLELYLPSNRRGITSPITSLVSTRQHDKDGTIYEPMWTGPSSPWRLCSRKPGGHANGSRPWTRPLRRVWKPSTIASR
jgi:hypothetical protein